MAEKIHIAILGAMYPEIAAFIALLQECKTYEFHGEKLWTGAYAGKTLLIGTVGFNKINAAITTAALLDRFRIEEVWHVGCAGAYGEGPLRVGDVLVTQRSLCGDEGVLTCVGTLSCREIGIPILARGGRSWYDEVPVDMEPEIMRRAKEKTPPGRYKLSREMIPAVVQPAEAVDEAQGEVNGNTGSFKLFYGPSLTVAMASGDAHIAGERFKCYRAFAENMEGSAVAQACFRFNVPILECRGMSNIAGDRNKEHWRMKEAIAHCSGIVLNWLV
jgi:futalosine hydrolase